MQPLNIYINEIQHRNKNHSMWFLYATYLVLTLFITQLLLAPLTFSNAWHCPMMGNTQASTAMNMEDCMHMQHTSISKNAKQDHQQNQKSQHGMVLCPLCTSFALPSPLLSAEPELPAISVIIITHQVKAYFSHAPPTKLVQENPARAPPSFRF